jgi:hypothetical protein
VTQKKDEGEEDVEKKEKKNNRQLDHLITIALNRINYSFVPYLAPSFRKNAIVSPSSFLNVRLPLSAFIELATLNPQGYSFINLGPMQTNPANKVFFCAI